VSECVRACVRAFFGNIVLFYQPCYLKYLSIFNIHNLVNFYHMLNFVFPENKTITCVGQQTVGILIAYLNGV